MTTVESISPQTSGFNLADSASLDKLVGKDAFLRLLVTQLRYQDPLSPLNNEAFVAQLAQFSSLEQLQNLNKSLSDYLDSSSLTAQLFTNTMAATFIGKDVKAAWNRVHLSEGSVELEFELSDNAADVVVEIFDADKNLVRSLHRSSVPSEENRVEWDGKDQQGNPVASGEYTFSVSATDVRGETVDSREIIQGKVTGVSYSEGNAFLMVGNNTIPLSEVMQVRDE